MMDVISSSWPLLAAGMASAGLAAGWWLVRSRSTGVSASSGSSRHREAGRRGAARGRQKPVSDDALDTVADWSPVSTRVLTSSERDAYHVLRRALPDHMILAQVPLARFVKVPTRSSYTEWLRRVGSLCADLVICDMSSQVVAVVEVRQAVSKEKERTLQRHARMDRVLKAADIPVHVWLDGALPGSVVAREAILGAAAGQSRRDAEAASVVAAMQRRKNGISPEGVQRAATGVILDEYLTADDWAKAEAEEARREPPPSTWFDDIDASSVSLEPRQGERV